MLCYVHCRFSYVTLGDLNCLDRVFCSGVHFLQDWLMIPLKMIYGTIWFVSSFCNFVSRVTGVLREVYPSTGCKKSRDAPPGVTPRTSPEPPPRPLPPIRRPINYPWLLARRHARAASGSTWNVAINEEEIFDAPSNGFGFDPPSLMNSIIHPSLPRRLVANGRGGGQCEIDTGDILASMGIPSWDFWDD